MLNDGDPYMYMCARQTHEERLTSLNFVLVCMQDAVDRGWLYTSTASHFTGVTDLRKLLLTALELANALAYLHSVDVMHGDLTGGNVLLHSSPITPTDPRGFIVKV